MGPACRGLLEAVGSYAAPGNGEWLLHDLVTDIPRVVDAFSHDFQAWQVACLASEGVGIRTQEKNSDSRESERGRQLDGGHTCVREPYQSPGDAARGRPKRMCEGGWASYRKAWVSSARMSTQSGNGCFRQSGHGRISGSLRCVYAGVADGHAAWGAGVFAHGIPVDACAQHSP